MQIRKWKEYYLKKKKELIIIKEILSIYFLLIHS